MKNKVVTFVILACLTAGAGKLANDVVEKTREPSVPAAVSMVVGSNSLAKVSEEFAKCSPEDKVVIYKLFAGSAEYLKNCESLTATSQFDPIFGRVKSSYGWSAEKYPAFTDAVSDYLVETDYVTPKELNTKEQRLAFAEIFQGLAEATKYE